MPEADLPSDLLILLRRLQAERPGSWLDDVADAVVSVGGTDSGDLLALSAERAACGLAQNTDTEAGDPERALAAMEEELRSTPPLPVNPADPQFDLLAQLPPATLPNAKPSPRSMDN